jgi:hypothetical protein
MRDKKAWNKKLAKNARSLDLVMHWLDDYIDDVATDWETQKSAHQARKFLELAQYEMWNMQWWENKKQIDLHREAHDTKA